MNGGSFRAYGWRQTRRGALRAAAIAEQFFERRHIHRHHAAITVGQDRNSRSGSHVTSGNGKAGRTSTRHAPLRRINVDACGPV